jgi:hypothetical protein
MRFKLMICALFMSLSSIAQDKPLEAVKRRVSDIRIVGKFVYLSKNDKRNILGQELYFSFTSDDGRQLAYPAKVRDEDLANKIKQNPSGQYYISAVPTDESLTVGEMQQKVHFLNIINASVVDLSSLGTKHVPGAPNAAVSGRQQMDRPTITGINDTITNSIIFSAGAALLGSMLIQ